MKDVEQHVLPGDLIVKRRRVDVDVQKLDELVDKSGEATLNDDERSTLKTAIHEMAQRLAAKYRSTEKTRKLFEMDKPEDEAGEQSSKPGHGRKAAADFTGATRVMVPHPALSSGCLCPDPDCRGKVYPLKDPSPLLRIVAMPPVQATVYDLQKLRCSVCDKVYTAPEPEGVAPEKYDETVATMVAIFRYGMGIPFTRLAGMQQHFGVPLSISTQYELVEEAAEVIQSIGEELVKQAAQGDILHSDDTGVRILNISREAGDKRTGLHTSGLVSVLDEGRRFIALYFSGTQHAGENLRDVLALRSQGLPTPIFMHDALSWNASKLSKAAREFIANCLAHGRRQLVELVGSFPSECLHVLEELGKVFKHDEDARLNKLNPKERLKHHQEHSKPIMKGLHAWISEQLKGKVEPNSGLGKALQYFLNHWKRLTLFLRVPGAPLENNICERALKKAVLQRKNSLFYKTLNGARVGDLFMSIIHTCELNGANPFDYLNELQRHAAELRASPPDWMPWNYRDQLLTPAS